jgi:hypothetical protein
VAGGGGRERPNESAASAFYSGGLARGRRKRSNWATFWGNFIFLPLFTLVTLRFALIYKGLSFLPQITFAFDDLPFYINLDYFEDSNQMFKTNLPLAAPDPNQMEHGPSLPCLELKTRSWHRYFRRHRRRRSPGTRSSPSAPKRRQPSLVPRPLRPDLSLLVCRHSSFGMVSAICEVPVLHSLIKGRAVAPEPDGTAPTRRRH